MGHGLGLEFESDLGWVIALGSAAGLGKFRLRVEFDPIKLVGRQTQPRRRPDFGWKIS